MLRTIATAATRRLLVTTCRISTHFSGISSRRLATAAISTVDRDENSILVNWKKDGDSWSKFHFDWLRDNCPCAQCKHPEYDQRLLTTLEDPIPTNVDVGTIGGTENAVGVEWRDGHRSQYPYSWLLANSYCHNNITKESNNERKMTLWDGNSTVTVNPPEVNYDDIITNDEKLLALLRNLYQYGFSFVLDTPPTKEAIMEAANRVGPIQNSYYGLQWCMEAGSMKISHVSYSRDKIMPHTDSPSFSDPPGVVWFHVTEFEDVQGGNTLLVDGFRLADHIKKQNPEYYTLLSEVSIPYQMTFKDEATYKMRRITFTTDEDNELSAVYLSNTDRRPLDTTSLSEAMEVLSCDADEAVRKMYEALRHLHHLLLNKQFAYKVQLQPGKMILINNHRVLHGRDEVVTGSRTLCGLWMCESEWVSKMKMLEQKLL